MNLATLLFDVARRLPEQRAVSDDRHSWNYRELAERVARLAGGLRAGGGGPGDPAWLFYTSGTTGRPKGAVLSHRNLLFMSQCYYADIDPVDERDAHLLAAPVSHGAGLYALPFVLKGAHQVVLPHFDVAEILEVIRRHPRVSLFAAPTMLTRLAHAPEVSGADLANLKTIYYRGRYP